MPNLRQIRSSDRGATPVDVATLVAVQVGTRIYGTTVPHRKVSVRPQVEAGWTINVDVGILLKGQLIAQIDDASKDGIERRASRTGGAESGRSTRSKSSQQCSSTSGTSTAGTSKHSQIHGDSKNYSEKERSLNKQRNKHVLRSKHLHRRCGQLFSKSAQNNKLLLRLKIVSTLNKLWLPTSTRATILCKLTSPISGIVTQRVTEEGNRTA